MLTVITYQIGDDKIRTRLHKLLKNFGKPVQKSVFECRLNKEQQKQLINRIDVIIPLISANDSIRIYNLCIKCVKNVKIIGKVPLTEEHLYYIV